MRCRQDRGTCCLGRVSPPLPGALGAGTAKDGCKGPPAAAQERDLREYRQSSDGRGLVGVFFWVSLLAIIDSFVSHLGGWQAVRTDALR